MKRLVYSPQVNAWVKTDSGVFDLSPYITDFSINRKVNQVSTAELRFRNPKVDSGDGQPRFLFTQHKTGNHYGPMFHPMDPIVITLTRIKGYPVQVFTGYCNSTPYIQLFPGVARLTASCTLKRLQYTYWDPGLPFVTEYMAENGWYIRDGQTINAQSETAEGNINDSSIGYLLYKVLMDIGGWEHKDIFIQGLPSEQITAIVEGLYEDVTEEAKASFETMRDFLSKTIGADNNLGGGDTTTTSDTASQGAPGTSGQITNEREIVIKIRDIAVREGVPPEFILTIGYIETGLSQTVANGYKSDGQGGQYHGWYQWLNPGGGYDGIPSWDWSKANDLEYATTTICRAAKHLEAGYKSSGLREWAARLQLGPSYKRYYSNNLPYGTESGWAAKFAIGQSLLDKYKNDQ